METVRESDDSRSTSTFLTYGKFTLLTLVGLGMLPRAGPVRALRLGASSLKWPFKPRTVRSVRDAEVASLKRMLDVHTRDQYIVVAGQKGIGKSVLVDTALEDVPGVLSFFVCPGATLNQIVTDVLHTVSRWELHLLQSDVRRCAARVIWWHTLFFRVRPTVVLRVLECADDEKQPEVGSAARVLCERGLRVVVDCLDTSLPCVATTRQRQLLLHVEPMEEAALKKVPELQDLLAALSSTGNAGVVWAVLGGVPASYRLLRSDWTMAGSPRDAAAVTEVVDRYLKCQLNDAASTLNSIRITTGAMPVPAPARATAAMRQMMRYSRDGKPLSVKQLRAALAMEESSAEV